jgi:hypothetical protein
MKVKQQSNKWFSPSTQGKSTSTEHEDEYMKSNGHPHIPSIRLITQVTKATTQV